MNIALVGAIGTKDVDVHIVLLIKKRFSLEDVRQALFKEDYVLLSDVYINAYNRISYKCPHGHIHETTYANWLKGRRCALCFGNPIVSMEIVKQSFKNAGYKLITNTYKSAHSKLYYVCPEGHRGSISWNNWQQGKSCFQCAVIKRADRKRTEFSLINEAFKNEGYKLLTKNYINCYQKLEFMCDVGHRHSISWNDWKYNGSRCKICADINMIGPNNPNWNNGSSFEPYCEVWNDKEFKSDIKERDAYTCQNPFCWETSERIVIHHIDYDKKNCHPDNLITVCNSCNARANVNREWHQEFYKNIIIGKLEIGGN